MVLWSTPDLKLYNKERIRKAIQRSEKSTKSSVSKTTSLSVATCNTFINEMLQDQEIVKIDQEDLIMGRPADRFGYNRDYHHVIGMYVSNEHGKNTVDASVADALGSILVREQLQPEIIEYGTLETLIGGLIDADPKINSITVGIPGITHNGVVESCDVETLVGADIEGNLTRKFGVCVEVRNDMDFLAYGAYHNIYRGEGNLATIYFPEENEGYVGCGFIVSGRVLRGNTKFAGELAYIMESFGISRKEQAKAWSRREDFLQYVSQIILIIISTLDPAEVVIMGCGITGQELDQIRALCERIVTDQHIPQLVVEQDYAACYRKGLVTAAINQKQFPLSEPI